MTEQASSPQRERSSVVVKVLYIEDNDDDVYMLKMRLELLGNFEVLTSADGEKGCEVAAAEQPILSDWTSKCPLLTARNGSRTDTARAEVVSRRRLMSAFPPALGGTCHPSRGASRARGPRCSVRSRRPGALQRTEIDALVFSRAVRALGHLAHASGSRCLSARVTDLND